MNEIVMIWKTPAETKNKVSIMAIYVAMKDKLFT